ncbi:carboxypeptidase regulatory-like domain-containing protein [Myceligenerans sp. TRM 65318]|uniref:alpha-amylase n=1 Tax=Myceligenerans pegani TaxID=2776917 RepID=A0ABR9N587_9MICO|nr:carboxypeptidase regulatory-like domain-containing protein [Myceligenerans sp. TRM 65318]MBE3021089.1 carboxypeptidase regulatory-like domain-containing protein [Myceligenerans sp. TRM 65318]
MRFLRRRALAAVLSAAAVLATTATVIPPAAAHEPGPEPTAVDEPTGRVPGGSPEEKVTKEVTEAFDQDERTDFWIRFDDHADLSPATRIADWAERGRFVVDTLENQAESSQADVVSELDAAAVEYRSFPIVNAIRVEGGSEDLALGVAASRDVIQVHEDVEVEPVEPVRPVGDDPDVPGEPVDERAAESEPGEDLTWGLEYIHAPEAWEMGATGAGITVSNLDSGVQFDHPALAGSYRGNAGFGTYDHDYNWFSTRGGCADEPCDTAGHGTHVMGTMVGSAEGHRVGVAPEAQWIATNGCCVTNDVTPLLDSGWWLLAPTDRNGENPDVSKRPHIVNNSWGIQEEGVFDDFFARIEEAWTASGIFSVWAAGNTPPRADCDSVSSPGAKASEFSVGAFDSDGVLGAFSRKGEGEDGAIKPNISAPGVDVESAWPGGGYNAIEGTSMAAPHVSGAVAALWSYDPTLVGDVELTRRLLAESAVDVDDTECGGTAAFNNKYGEGRLDLVRLLQLAPRDGGTITGRVTSGGEPVPGASLQIDGPFSRTLGVDDDGTFSAHLPEGEFEITTRSFGHVRETTTVTITRDQETALEVDLDVAPRHTVTGTVVDPDGEPVARADVSVRGTPLDTVSTGEDGTFTLPDVPEDDEYVLVVRPNGCFSPTTLPMVVDGAQELTVPVGLVVDEWGYTCEVTEGEHLRGEDRLEFSRDDAPAAQVELPFPVALYNGSHTTLNVGARGVIAPVPPGPTNGIPGPGTGGAGIFPFWNGSLLDHDEGGIYTAVTTLDGEDAFVVEYRDVRVRGGSAQPGHRSAPISFSVTITRSGRIVMGYGDGVGGEDPLTGGSTATTGIQGWEGQEGIRFSRNQPVLRDGMIVTYDMPDFGYADIDVTDANDGRPVAGATVAISDAGGLVESLTTTDAGEFRRQLHTGSYTMTVTAPNYEAQTREFTLDELYSAVKLDVPLRTGAADVAVSGLDAVLGAGQGGQGTLTLTNSGSRPLSYDLEEMARHPELDRADAAGLDAETVSPAGDGREVGMSGWTRKAPSATDVSDALTPSRDPYAGGGVLARISLPGTIEEKEPTGIGYDGDVWIHDAMRETNTAYTVTGQNTGKEFAAEWNTQDPAYGAFDMAFDSRMGDMCQMEDSPTGVIHCFDTETGEKTREVKGEWSEIPLTGLAYDANRDVYYVGGWFNGRIGTVAGSSHENAGEMIDHCVPPLREVIGLAYNTSSDTIWYVDRAEERRTRLIQVRPDCSFVKAWWFPDARDMQGGGLEADVTGALWAVDQMKDEVLLVEVEDDQYIDLPWLSLSRTEGMLAPGESAEVAVRMSADTDPKDVLGANIVVRTDAGRRSKQYVPVTVTTSEYQVGVNAGGGAYTDRVGFTWAADQELRSGRHRTAWGWTGRTGTASTRWGIEGTQDDDLFRTQRVTRGKNLVYKFGDAPEGTYVVDLGFAEIEGARPGKRVFDVLVNGDLMSYAYDPAGRAGNRTAEVRSVVVEHDSGPLEVELRGTNGLRPPSLASLRVTLDSRPEITVTEPEVPAEEPERVPVAPAFSNYEQRVSTGMYRQGTTLTPLGNSEGRNEFAVRLNLGFDFPFYDRSYDSLWLYDCGVLDFERNSTGCVNRTLPFRYAVHPAIFPFWDTTYADDESGVYLASTEVDGLEAIVVEYRNLTVWEERDVRFSYSITLIEDGRIQIGYGPGMGGEHPLTQGAGATVGIQSDDPSQAWLFSYDEPVISEGMALEYARRGQGMLEGTVTDANDGEPLAGAVVTLTDAEGTARAVTTNKQGRWKAQMLLGEHTVEVTAPGYVADTRDVTFTEPEEERTLDAALATGIAEVEADGLDRLVAPGRTDSGEVTITNTGSAPMEVSVTTAGADGGEAIDLPWLTLSGDATGGVALAPGESTTVTATLDAAASGPGRHTADLLITADAGRDPERRVPVRLGVSDYWRAVDAGGRGLTGSDGVTWAADRPLRGGADWGHTGGRTRSTRAGIAGTEDDRLYRTQRTGREFSYVFRDVPAGTYRIGLGFAEIEHVGPGRRTFDVVVDGEALLYEHDVREDAGWFAAAPRDVVVRHDGGDLEIEFVGEAGERGPILNALTVQDDPRG